MVSKAVLLSARDIARLGPATQGIMVAHSVRNAKVFFRQRGRRKNPAYAACGRSRWALLFLQERGLASETVCFSGSPFFSPGSPYYVIPALSKVNSESSMSGRHINPGKRRASFGHRASALLLGAWVLAAAPVCADPFRFPWDPPPPTRAPGRPLQDRPLLEQQPSQEQRPLGPARISVRQVRAILAREGAQMIGKPRAIRDELIVLGRDSNGEGKKYILDAISGDVLEVLEARLPEPRRDLGSPLPPPDQAPSPGDGRIESAPLGAPPQSPPVASAPPPGSAPAPDRSNSALSPIKPLRPSGAPGSSLFQNKDGREIAPVLR